MYTLDLADHLFAEILDGYKVNTIRRGVRHITPGPLTFRAILDPNLTVTVTATSVEHMRLLDIPRVISTKETLEQLLLRMREYYPDIDPHEMMTLVEFKAPRARNLSV